MFEDKTLVCKECGQEFVFTAGEQEFYAEKGFENEPFLWRSLPGSLPAPRGSSCLLQRLLRQDERGAVSYRFFSSIKSPSLVRAKGFFCVWEQEEGAARDGEMLKRGGRWKGRRCKRLAGHLPGEWQREK